MYSIAAASIIAKVKRDEIMTSYDAEYPVYGLAQHKGYPTAAHRAALSRHGPSAIHRMSYRPVYESVKGYKKPADSKQKKSGVTTVVRLKKQNTKYQKKTSDSGAQKQVNAVNLARKEKQAFAIVAHVDAEASCSRVTRSSTRKRKEQTVFEAKSHRSRPGEEKVTSAVGDNRLSTKSSSLKRTKL